MSTILPMQSCNGWIVTIGYNALVTVLAILGIIYAKKINPSNERFIRVMSVTTLAIIAAPAVICSGLALQHLGTQARC